MDNLETFAHFLNLDSTYNVQQNLGPNYIGATTHNNAHPSQYMGNINQDNGYIFPHAHHNFMPNTQTNNIQQTTYKQNYENITAQNTAKKPKTKAVAVSSSPSKPKKPRKSRAKNPDGTMPEVKKRVRRTETWQRNQRKFLRNSGLEYVNSAGKVVDSRKPGPDCGCKKKCYTKVPPENRETLFREFYKMPNKEFQDTYLGTLIAAKDVKRRRGRNRLTKKAEKALIKAAAEAATKIAAEKEAAERLESQERIEQNEEERIENEEESMENEEHDQENETNERDVKPEKETNPEREVKPDKEERRVKTEEMSDSEDEEFTAIDSVEAEYAPSDNDGSEYVPSQNEESDNEVSDNEGSSANGSTSKSPDKKIAKDPLATPKKKIKSIKDATVKQILANPPVGFVNPLPNPEIPIKDKRNFTFYYHIKIGKKLEEVCRTAFCNIHGVSRSRVSRVALACADGNTVIVRDKRGKHQNRPNKISQETKDSVHRHISSFSFLDVPGSRKSSKKYLPAELSIKNMHEMYLQQNEPEEYVKLKRKEVSKPKVSYDFYYRYFHDNFNIQFGLPGTESTTQKQTVNKKDSPVKLTAPHYTSAPVNLPSTSSFPPPSLVPFNNPLGNAHSNTGGVANQNAILMHKKELLLQQEKAFYDDLKQKIEHASNNPIIDTLSEFLLQSQMRLAEILANAELGNHNPQTLK